jgi:hypothetical protein
MKTEGLDRGIEVDFETRRRKQRELMVQLVERQVRSRAQQLYDERGQGDGHALQDWVKAEKEILENSILASLYRRLKGVEPPAIGTADAMDFPAGDASTCESPA